MTTGDEESEVENKKLKNELIQLKEQISCDNKYKLTCEQKVVNKNKLILDFVSKKDLIILKN